MPHDYSQRDILSRNFYNIPSFAVGLFFSERFRKRYSDWLWGWYDYFL